MSPEIRAMSERAGDFFYSGAGTGALPGAGVSSLLTVVFTLPRLVAARKSSRLPLI
jgi:hypothetical protein